MPSTATVTGKAGPGIALTAQVFTNVTDIKFDIPNKIMQFTSNGLIKFIDINADTTITITAVSTTSWVITVS